MRRDAAAAVRRGYHIRRGKSSGLRRHRRQFYVSFNWNVSVVNAGSVETTGEVTVTDILPANILVGAMYDGEVIAGGPRFRCTLTGQSVFCSTNDPLPAGSGEIPVVALSVYATSGTTAMNAATVNWSTGAKTSPTWTTSLTDAIVRKAKVRARAGGVAAATVGVPFNWTMELLNVGDAPSSGVLTVIDDIDPALVINSVTPASGVTCDVAGSTVTCVTSNAVPPMIGDGNIPDTIVATISVTAPTLGLGAVSHQETVSWDAAPPATMGSSTSHPWWTALQ